MYRDKKVSLVLPAYNEEGNIAAAVREFQGTGVFDEIIVVNNNSRDQTRARALETGARVIDEAIQGFGAALQRGLKEATGDLVVLAEPDGTFIPGDVTKLLAYSEDFDVVLGTRTARELIWKGANMGAFLRWGNVAVGKLLEVLYSGPCLTDCGCTFRLIRKSAYNVLAPYLTVRGSHFLPQMVIMALRKKLKVIEIPLNYRTRIGESKITGTFKGTFTTGMRMLGLILGYRVRPPR